MDSLGELLAEARDREGVAFTAPDRSTDYSFREFCTAAWKAGNLLSHYGVHDGATVTVVVGPAQPDGASVPGRLGDTPEPLFGTLGTWLLGGTVDLDPAETIDGPAILGPAAWLEQYTVRAGCTRLAYGDVPDDPALRHFERERWSENPVAPPDRVSNDAVAVAGSEGLTQRELLEATRTAVTEGTIGVGDRVGLDAPLAPDTLAVGVLAPLAAGATMVGGSTDGVDVLVDGRGATRLSD